MIFSWFSWLAALLVGGYARRWLSRTRWRPYSRLRETCTLGLFSDFNSHVKINLVTIQWIKPRSWDTTDDWYIKNLANNQVSAVFLSRVICRSVSPKFIQLCMEMPCVCPSEGNKHGGRKVTETSCYWNEKLLL